MSRVEAGKLKYYFGKMVIWYRGYYKSEPEWSLLRGYYKKARYEAFPTFQKPEN